MQYVYILESASGDFYTGCTSDLNKRLKEHHLGKSTYTKHRGPYKLIYYEACLNSKDGYVREKYLKSAQGKRYLKNRLKRYFENNLKGAVL